MTEITWKTGFEIELLAPRGQSRADLAQALADGAGGRVARVFSPQSEISEVPGMPVFENLTLAFDAMGADGALIARCADDLTIAKDLDHTAPPFQDWYRIVSDDLRLLRLAMAQCDPAADRSFVLEPMARLFGTGLHENEDGMVRLTDAMGASVAIAAPLPSERERPCEIITPPIERGHDDVLEQLISTATALGFTVPAEAAVHIHYDASPLRDARTLANLIPLLERDGAFLRERVGTNPMCRRLGDLPPPLIELVSEPGFASLDWPRAQARLAGLDLIKFCDFNILNLVHDTPGKQTFEVRILPGSMKTTEILCWTRLFAAILEWAIAATGDIPARSDFYAALPLLPQDRAMLGL